ncbi:MAG TPA: YkgJ family cysteine cluster protein [Tepidisphaeraceae bacterium]|nr:YkgJ family cysteine cluster protein [Tepidisphaeraceae bacterium]
MQLKVLTDDPSNPWYADGLRFTCTQCGNCCSGKPGHVWISREEVQLLAEHLQLTPAETIEQFCLTINGQLTLRERRNRHGDYDCIFLRTESSAPQGDGSGPVFRRRYCGIYPVRPLQCRTWPFWDSNLATEKAWKQAARTCYGMDRGRKFSLKVIEALRDADKWPDDAPTSQGD